MTFGSSACNERLGTHCNSRPDQRQSVPLQSQIRATTRNHHESQACDRGNRWVFTLLAIGAGVWWVRHEDDKKAAAQKGPPHVSFVDIATVEAGQWQPKARLCRTVFPKRSVTVSNEVTGVATEVGFDSGVTVEPGQILLKLDSRTEQADLAAAEAAERLAKASVDSAMACNARVAETNLNLAKSNQRRYADAAAARSVSESEVHRVNAEVDKATADLERGTAP